MSPQICSSAQVENESNPRHDLPSAPCESSVNPSHIEGSSPLNLRPTTPPRETQRDCRTAPPMDDKGKGKCKDTGSLYCAVFHGELSSNITACSSQRLLFQSLTISRASFLRFDRTMSPALPPSRDYRRYPFLRIPDRSDLGLGNLSSSVQPRHCGPSLAEACARICAGREGHVFIPLPIFPRSIQSPRPTLVSSKTQDMVLRWWASRTSGARSF